MRVMNNDQKSARASDSINEEIYDVRCVRRYRPTTHVSVTEDRAAHRD